MSDIVNAQAVKFCNQNARTIADLIAKLDRTLPEFALNVVRDFENQTGGNVDEDRVIDGATTVNGVNEDGRTKVTKVRIAELKFVCEQLAAVMNTSNYRALVNNWVTNGNPIF